MQPVPLARELLAELDEQLLLPESVFHRLEDAPFDLVAPDRELVRADASVARARAGQAILREHREAATAEAALRQAGEEVHRTPCAHKIRSGSERLPSLALSRFRGLPQVVGNDPESGHRRDRPCGFRVVA